MISTVPPGRYLKYYFFSTDDMFLWNMNCWYFDFLAKGIDDMC